MPNLPCCFLLRVYEVFGAAACSSAANRLLHGQDDDVFALREEKRKLVLEEKRLKALRDGLKSDANLQRKKDRLVRRHRCR